MGLSACDVSHFSSVLSNSRGTPCAHSSQLMGTFCWTPPSIPCSPAGGTCCLGIDASWHLLPQDNDSQNPAVLLSLQWHLVKDSLVLKKTSVVKISDFLTKGSRDSIRGGDCWVDRPSGCCGKIYLQHCGKRYGWSQHGGGRYMGSLAQFLKKQ